MIVQGLIDEKAKLGDPFKLEIVAEHVEKVTWMLEQEVIEPEPEEGLIIMEKGSILDEI